MSDWIFNLPRIIVPLVIILLIVFGVDTVTGILKGIKNCEFSSTKLRGGCLKLAGYFAIIIGAIVIDFIINLYMNSDFNKIEFISKVLGNYQITKGMFLFVIVIEVISIIENAKELGVDIPNWFMKLLDKMKLYLSGSEYDIDENLLTKDELQELLNQGEEDEF